MILYINSCVRENSRTDRIARAVLSRMNGEICELYLPEAGLQPLSRERLDRRTALIEKKDFTDPMFRYAKQFAEADKIVIAAPFWDLSFPSVLKVYFENIFAIGIVTDYDAQGQPFGLCRAKELIYVTTAGGSLVPDFGYGYVKALAQHYFGIPEVKLIKAEMLDIAGFDAEAIVAETIAGLG